MNAYAKTPTTTLTRSPKRGAFDRPTVHAILDAGLVAHVSVVIDGRPRTIPTLHWRDGETLFIHGSTRSSLIQALEAGRDACVTVTMIDGLVLARSAFHHSVNYRSVVCYGRASSVTDARQKLRALEGFVERLVPGRWNGVRKPSASELMATAVIAFPLAEVSAKVRQGPPNDDRSDMMRAVWAGEIPIERRFGTPLPDGDAAARCDAPLKLIEPT